VIDLHPFFKTFYHKQSKATARKKATTKFSIVRKEETSNALREMPAEC